MRRVDHHGRPRARTGRAAAHTKTSTRASHRTLRVLNDRGSALHRSALDYVTLGFWNDGPLAARIKRGRG